MPITPTSILQAAECPRKPFVLKNFPYFDGPKNYFSLKGTIVHQLFQKLIELVVNIRRPIYKFYLKQVLEPLIQENI